MGGHCIHGRAKPDKQTTLRLFAESGGYCQNPCCSNKLFVETGTSTLHIAEMAHIIAAKENGPRGRSTLSAKERNSYENLILLCANCHTIIDKAPHTYPDMLIRQWKSEHLERIHSLFGAVEFFDRASAREAIGPPLAENQCVFDQFGPDNDYHQDPESELAAVWQRKLRSIVLPNNRKVLTILDKNRRLLTTGEIQVLETFRQHVDDLEAKHLGGQAGQVASRYPAGMKSILVDCGND